MRLESAYGNADWKLSHSQFDCEYLSDTVALPGMVGVQSGMGFWAGGLSLVPARSPSIFV